MVATSSGEAEFYALSKSAWRTLGAVAMVVGMAKVVKPRVREDATASKARASRRGVGRVSHLHVQVLRVQKAVARRELTIARVPGFETPCRFGHETVGSEGDARGLRDLSQRPCWGYEYDRLRTS